MYQERIRSTPSWHGSGPRHDTVFVEIDGDQDHGMLGMAVGRVLLFFSFKFEGVVYPCALISWFMPIGQEPDPDTGLWLVEPQNDLAVIHTDCIPRATHLIPNYGSDFLPNEVSHSNSLDLFQSFFINAYVDHHTHEFLSPNYNV